MDKALFLDLARGIHLLCVALGMGPAIYFDLRSLRRIARLITKNDINELHRIHTVVTIACAGLWVSGVALVWMRTSFDLAEFTPKLWSKLFVVSVLTANSLVLNVFAIPALARYQGLRLIDLPVKALLAMMFCAGVSLSCWVLALALGSSRILKSAQWDTLLPVLAGGAALCISGVLVVSFGARAVFAPDCDSIAN